MSSSSSTVDAQRKQQQKGIKQKIQQRVKNHRSPPDLDTKSKKKCHFDHGLMTAGDLQEIKTMFQDYINNIQFYAVICSHHARIVCFLMKIASLSSPQIDIGFNNAKSKKGLQNVAVVKLSFLLLGSDQSGVVLVELLYPGYSDPIAAGKKEKYDYWAAQGSGYVFLLSADICKQVFIKDDTNSNGAPISSVLYMVRHGQGEHNLSGLRNKLIWDPLLVSDEGIKGATESICRDLKTSQTNSFHSEIKVGFFSSPLQRCIETLCLFFYYWNKLSLPLSTLRGQIPNFPSSPSISVQILPCIHELRASIKKGHLDGSCDQPFNTLTAVPSWWKLWEYGNFENTSKCLRNTDDCIKPKQFLTTTRNTKKSRAVHQLLTKLQSFRINIQMDWELLKSNNPSCIHTLFTQFITTQMFTFPLRKTDADPARTSL